MQSRRERSCESGEDACADEEEEEETCPLFMTRPPIVSNVHIDALAAIIDEDDEGAQEASSSAGALPPRRKRRGIGAAQIAFCLSSLDDAPRKRRRRGDPDPVGRHLPAAREGEEASYNMAACHPLESKERNA